MAALGTQFVYEIKFTAWFQIGSKQRQVGSRQRQVASFAYFTDMNRPPGPFEVLFLPTPQLL